MSKGKLFLVFLLLACLSFPQVSQAAVNIDDVQLIPDECREGRGEDCDLDSFLQMFVNFAQLLLAALTIFTLLMFVWSSFGLATSMGNPEKVKGAKDGMIGAIFGMVVVIAAWALVNTMMCLLIVSEENPQCLIFGRPWWGYGESVGDCRSKEPYSSTDCHGSNLYNGCGDSLLTNNTDVADLQRQLIDLQCGFIGSIDGCFGPETELAVLEFQYGNGLTADGIVGPETSNTLQNPGAIDCSGTQMPEGEVITPTADQCCIPFDLSRSCLPSNGACPTGTMGRSEACSEIIACTSGCCYDPGNQADCRFMRQEACDSADYTWEPQFMGSCPETCGLFPEPTGCCYPVGSPSGCYHTIPTDCPIDHIFVATFDCPAECPDRPQP